MNSLVALTGALAAGAGLAYVLDPDRGRRRRALASDQLVSATHAASSAIDATSRDVRNRLSGTAARVRGLFKPVDVSDAMLRERVRARMGSVVRHARAIDVTVREGFVTLRGPIFSAEVGNLLRRVRGVRGVRGIDNQLDARDVAGDVSALQGEGPMTGVRSTFMQASWSPTARLVAGAAGAALATYGVLQRGIVGSVLGLTGLTLLARAASNLELARLAHVVRSGASLDVDEENLTSAASA
jgi:hypothetical protein